MIKKISLSLLSIAVTLLVMEALLSFLDMNPPRPYYSDKEVKSSLSTHFEANKNVSWKMIPDTKFELTTENPLIT